MGLPGPFCYLPKKYNPTKICKYHSNTPGHELEDYEGLKDEIQSLIDRGVVAFDDGDNPQDVIITLMGKPAYEVFKGEVAPQTSIRSCTSKEAKDFWAVNPSEEVFIFPKK